MKGLGRLGAAILVVAVGLACYLNTTRGNLTPTSSQPAKSNAIPPVPVKGGEARIVAGGMAQLYSDAKEEGTVHLWGGSASEVAWIPTAFREVALE